MNLLEIAIKCVLSLEPALNLFNIVSSVKEKKELDEKIKEIYKNLEKEQEYYILKLNNLEYKIIDLFVSNVKNSSFNLGSLTIDYLKEELKINELNIDDFNLAIFNLKQKDFFCEITKKGQKEYNFTLSHYAMWKSNYFQKKSDNNYSFTFLLISFLKYIKINLDKNIDTCFISENIIKEVSLEDYMLNSILFYIASKKVIYENKTIDGRIYYQTKFYINKTEFLYLLKQKEGNNDA
jgi:hypothetical protein